MTASVLSSVSEPIQAALPVCLFENPYRLVSLLEIVKTFDASGLFGAVRKLTITASLLHRSIPQSVRVNLVNTLVSDLDQCHQMCKDLNLLMAALRASQMIKAVDSIWSLSPEACEECANGIQRDLSLTIENELSLRRFFTLLPEQARRYDQPFEGWEDIVAAFPDSTEDVEEMNVCFAMKRYSAAVFHSLLVSECGIVQLGRVLGVTDPKEGWDATCKKMESIFRTGHSAVIPTGLDFAFIEQVNVVVQAMKHAWRNKVNHAAGKLIVMKSGFGEPIADEIITATRAFMRTLAQGLPLTS